MKQAILSILLLVTVGSPALATDSPATRLASIECPPDGIAEGEPDCYEGYFDSFNPGCTWTPRVYTTVPCTEDTLRICGRYGRNEYWDLDWYWVTLSHRGNLDVCVQGEGRAQLVIINPTCTNPEVMHCNMVADPNGRVCCSPFLEAGVYLVFIRPYHVNSNIPCGSKYLLEIHGIACPMATEPTGWTQVKVLYRD